jgi:folate-binding protein YgfZ
MTDPAVDPHAVESLRSGAAAVRLARDVVRVGGPEALDYLQGQLSQDVVGLPIGASAWSFVLQPQGKVDAWFRVTRTGDDEVVLDVDPGWGDALAARLDRFKLRTRADVESLDWSCVAVRGPGAPGPDALADAAPVVAVVDWPPLVGVDLLGPDVAVPDGLVEVDRSAHDALRIEAGLPAMGAEITEATIPAEVGVVPRSVSFTKGCYTGQELVARIDSRGGRTPRRLVRWRVDGAVPPAGATASDEAGKEIGRLTSVAATAEGAVALGPLARGVEAPARLTLRWDGDAAEATAEPLALDVDSHS